MFQDCAPKTLKLKTSGPPNLNARPPVDFQQHLEVKCSGPQSRMARAPVVGKFVSVKTPIPPFSTETHVNKIRVEQKQYKKQSEKQKKNIKVGSSKLGPSKNSIKNATFCGKENKFPLRDGPSIFMKSILKKQGIQDLKDLEAKRREKLVTKKRKSDISSSAKFAAEAKDLLRLVSQAGGSWFSPSVGVNVDMSSTTREAVDDLSGAFRDVADSLEKAELKVGLDSETAEIANTLTQSIKDFLNKAPDHLKGASAEFGNFLSSKAKEMLLCVALLAAIGYCGVKILQTGEKKYVAGLGCTLGVCALVSSSSLKSHVIGFVTETISRFNGGTEDLKSQAGNTIKEAIASFMTVGVAYLTIGSAPEKKKLSSFVHTLVHAEKLYDGVNFTFSAAMKILEKIINWLRDKVSGYEPIRLMKEEDPIVEAWIVEVERVNHNIQKGNFPIVQENADIVYALEARGNKMLATMVSSKDRRIETALRTYCNVLKAIKAPFDAANLSGYNVRQQPLTIFIRGEPGVGKSVMVNHLLIDVMAAVLPSEMIPSFAKSEMDHIYVRQAEHCYWDGYHNQFCCVFDDFGQARDVSGTPDNEYMDLIRASNMFPDVLHMAELQNKGNVNFTSKIILANTNLRTINPNSIQFKEAITRRMDVAVQVFPRVEFCQPERDGAPENRRLDRTKVGMYNLTQGLHRDAWQKDVYEFQLYDFHKGSRLGPVFAYDEMVERCISVFRGMRCASKAFEHSIDTTKTLALQKRALATPVDESKDEMDALEEEVMKAFKSQAGGESSSAPPIPKPQGEEFYDAEEIVLEPFKFKFANKKTKDMSLEEVFEAVKMTEQDTYDIQNDIDIHLRRYTRDQVLALSKYIRKKFGTDNVNYVLKCLQAHFTTAFNQAMMDGPRTMMIFLCAVSGEDAVLTWLHEGYPHPGLSERFSNMMRRAKIQVGLFFKEIRNKVLSFCQRWICYWDLFEVIKFGVLIEVGITVFSSLLWAGSSIYENRRIANEATKAYKSVNGVMDRTAELYSSNLERNSNAYRDRLENLLEGEPAFRKIIEPKGEMDPTDPGDILQTPMEAFSRIAKDTPEGFLHTPQRVAVDQMISESTNLRKPRANVKGQAREARKAFRTQACIDHSSKVIIDKITHRNLYNIVYNKDIKMGTVLFVKNRTFLFPTHFRHRILSRISDGAIDPNSVLHLKPAFTGATLSVPVSHFVSSENFVDLPNKDLSLYKCPHLVPPKTDIVKFFLPSYMIHPQRDYTVMLTNPKEKVVERIFSPHAVLQPEKRVDNEDCGQIVVHGAMLYHAPTDDGDCGALLSLVDKSTRHHKLLGLHVAGNHQNLGLASIVTLEELQDNLDKFETKDVQQVPFESEMYSQCKSAPFSLPFEPLYEHELKVFSPKESKIVKSALYGAWKEPETKPAHLQPFMSTEGVKDPMAYALSKYCSESKPIPMKYYQAAADSLYSDMVGKLRTAPRSLRVLTFEEAVEGIPGEIESLPMNTSPGFPHNAVSMPGFPGKTRFFGKDELKDFTREEALALKEEVLDIIEKANKGIRLEHIYSDFLKDERRPIAKVDAGKTRLISCAPLAMTIACRMLTLKFSAMIQQHNAYLGFGIGVNPYSADWDFVARMLLQFGDENVIAGDYTNHDGSLTLPLMMAAMSVVNRFYNDDYTKAREILTLDVGNSRHINWNKVYQWNKGLASGHAWTALLGSMGNHINIRSAWVIANDADVSSLALFNRNVYILVLGDDLIMVVSGDYHEVFSPKRVSECLAVLGMTFTDEEKNASRSSFRSLNEVSFLKRSFRYENSVGRFVGPLDLSTILEMPFWTKSGPAEKTITMDNLWFALKELSLHGPEVYQHWAPKLIKASIERMHHCPPLQEWSDVLTSALSMKLIY